MYSIVYADSACMLLPSLMWRTKTVLFFHVVVSSLRMILADERLEVYCGRNVARIELVVL